LNLVGRLLDKLGAAMVVDFDFSQDVGGLQVPTLIVAADADMAPPSDLDPARSYQPNDKRHLEPTVQGVSRRPLTAVRATAEAFCAIRMAESESRKNRVSIR
jgi:hypothetical protein